MSSGNISLLTLTVKAAGALAACRFVKQDGNYPAAGGNAFGVTRSSAALAGDLVPVDVMGTAIVEVGGAVVVDDLVMADASGRAVKATVGSKFTLAKVMEAGNTGATVEVLLIPNAGYVTAAS
jgi:hypothetical protein